MTRIIIHNYFATRDSVAKGRVRLSRPTIGRVRARRAAADTKHLFRVLSGRTAKDCGDDCDCAPCKLNRDTIPLNFRDSRDSPTMTKDVAGYVEPSSSSNHCADCTMFRKPHACTLVTGEISEVGVCKHFEAR